ncbi:MAG TPA: hypothetical protein ENK49_03915 [Gammaproteobacteria bacterium]|nr:hypothetical protein [Gammaproteobacteria bacterium]
MKKILVSLLAAGSMHMTAASAQELDVTITNLTNAVYFTPLLVSAHNGNTHLFQAGHTASAELQAMAEGGDTSGLQAHLASIGADSVANPNGGLLAPGATTTAHLRTHKGNRRLSVVAMLLPTNDGFAGLNAIRIPRKHGTYTYYMNGYDAGTEANDEIINGGGAPGVPGIPADPGGNSGSGASGVTTTEHNTTVHIHRGTLGDMDLNGGISDLDSRVHHWLNPVAKVVITVRGRKHHEHDD